MSDQDRLADFARIGAVWLWETDSDDRFSYFSAATSPSGIDLARRIGGTRRDSATPDDENLVRLAALDGTIATRQPFHDVVYRARMGEEPSRWCSISGEPRRAADGRFLGYRGVGRDVTAQVETTRGA